MRHLLFLSVPLLTAAAVATACGHMESTTSDDADAGDQAAAGGVTATPPATPASTAPSGAAGTGLATGLPCDVQGVLENRCIGCHGDPPVPGAPLLLSYDSLVAPSKDDPTKTLAQEALDKMTSKQMPPPPAVPPADDEIAAFQAWVTAGTPKNPTACTDPPPAAPDGGASADAGVVCTSGKHWTGGDDGSQLMHPGGACNTCHQKNDGPNLRVGGTVFPTAHEPDDCNGAAPPPQLTVVITDAQNKVFRLAVNSAGNFLTENRVRLPIRAQVTNGTKTRSMNGSVTSGDCNSCHTVQGANGAPGRIMAP
jgi:mono/diheme cytochrome c family protein